MGVFMIPLSSEGSQVSVEVMAVHNLAVSVLPNAVQVVPHPDAIVNAGRHQLAACLGAEVCTVDQAGVLKACKLTCAGHPLACTPHAWSNTLAWSETHAWAYTHAFAEAACSL